ncbi:hypothetical protein G9A89_015043 [Geosiphon pyriformis]|nr:hypothetical protein G9A89_015043 [Geosiphon pyriformis]
MLKKKLMKLWFWEATDKTITTESLSIIQRTQPINLQINTSSDFHPRQQTSTNSNHSKVAESENIGANHLGFAKFFQQLGLNNNYFPAKSAFNFYVNDKITDCLGGTVNIETTRKNFYTELFQHTSFPRNYSFTPIIKEINQTIERYTQQQFPITYVDKGKRKLQTLAVTLRQILPPTWKKTRVESPTNPLYHYTLGSTINISSTGTSQNYWELMAITLKDLNRDRQCHQDFDTHHLSQISEPQEKEKEFEDQEFTYQNPIPENPDFGTPNFQT